MVLGLLTSQDVDVTIKNLQEAGFWSSNIILFNHIDTTMLNRLKSYRIEPPEANYYKDQVMKGNILVVISGVDDADELAKQMLEDHSAREVKIIKNSNLFS